jgi:serine/threonine-protein kinase
MSGLAVALGDRYRIERELGRGGMATVYQAQDLKHDRKVAVKVLHPELTAVLGPERFLREIRIAAKLNHPHILPLHDSGQAGGFLYYVMPVVEGESLRARLSREVQLSVEEAVQIARQVASALDHAHRHTVVHRDIKPENILLQEGEAMVADFGIALAVHAAAGERLTETGLSLGTPEYMSPEQASGDPRLDARTDVYSAGVVLYEMLAGEPPFTGPSTQAIVAKVLTERPTDVRARRDTVPEPLARIVAKALAKLPADRFANAAELADALARALPATAAPYAPWRPRLWAVRRGLRAVRWHQAFPWMVAVLGLVVGISTVVRTRQSPGPGPVRLTIPLPGDQRLIGGPSTPFAISPQGTRLVYAATRLGRTQLYLREFEAFEPHPIAGTEGAIAPFFSPDGEWVGFFADGQLKKVPVGGGAPVTICSAPWSSSWGFAASWSRDGDIIFAPGLTTGLFRVSAAGGRPEALTTPDAAAGEIGHGWPQVLEDQTVLFTIAARDGRSIALLSPDDRRSRILLRSNVQLAGARHSPTGHVLYGQSGGLVAVRLDTKAASVTGSPVAIQDSVYAFGSALPYFAISVSGSLVYSPGTAVPAENRLMWVHRDGRTVPLATHRGTYWYPRLAPDGRRVAVAIDEEGQRDLWIYEVDGGRRIRLTVGGINADPVWTPDGRQITFASNRAGSFDLYSIAGDGAGQPVSLLVREGDQFPHSWSPDGRTLAFYELTPTTARDIWLLTMEGDSASVRPVLVTPFNERSPTFSADGRWLAYVSDESGRDEVYVRPYPELDAKWTVSGDGGREPVWSVDGRRLFYRYGDQVMVVAIETRPTFRAGQPEVVFRGRYDAPSMSSGSLNYHASPDGQRFIVVQGDEESAPQVIRVVLNWFEELRQRVGTQQN